MSSQGQRFRRRALRRGYKVDEVDTFLDRVEATLAGEAVGAPVGAQEVHDVVFRVRFGGYDEWQVDLHLDRVERQLAELEERGGHADGRGMPGGQAGDRMSPGDRMGPGAMPGGMGPGGMAPPTERLPAPMRGDERMPMRGDERMPMRGDERMPMRGDERMPMRGDERMPMRGDERMPMRGDERMPMRGDDRAPMPDDRPMSGPPMPQRQQQPQHDPYGRYDDPAGYGQPPRPGPGGYDTGSFGAFEPGRHGKADMTAEIRMPERERDRDRGWDGPSPMSGPPMPSRPMSAPPTGGMPPPAGPPMGGGPGGGGPGMGPPMGGQGGPGGELHRVDQLRRTFQPRRFGSGYDPMQVDRLFESILQAMSGRGPMPVAEEQLDTLQFGLVPGGYFEAEVDQALREVKDILLRRR
ncbi:DivIVA domain-containing protein [Mangrovihabitans endophyticus]|uniref:DivIVA domain-containing protein n=1 Tax=Mangrovihabitans endophyticus TaxID=1751298 RepID=A0A8J3BXY2_9ACTN|nr:DivIVA domain-containing protein [Mangrovihabitans endophyticus]GGK89981.1 hypothetical protein GCM10012284_24920 [Mangrovihabitans endophyticus]